MPGMRVEQTNVIQLAVSLDAIDCPNCGVVFAVTSEFDQRRREDGETFYCPSGHPMSYSETLKQENRRLRDKNARLLATVDQLQTDTRQLQNDVMDKAKEVRRLKQRSKAGLCTECRRHFANLQRHMETKHPTSESSKGKGKA
ncbi:MAG: hypothetical protein AMJ38_02215 [Dehalococcoidia bacterium DG_22]|nr:MAG: hypothetical protein AMJ38_02215 [Dehalococcoidia bacterium DG_22]